MLCKLDNTKSRLLQREPLSLRSGAPTLPYLMWKACYRLALRPPVGPMRVPELTSRLLEPLGIFSSLQERTPMFLS